MVLTAFRGALGFLSRLPIGRDDASWDAFRERPEMFPLAGYAIGFLVALPLLLPLPTGTVAFAFVMWLYLVTGVNHLDGLADVGDAAVIHGDPSRRRQVMTDTTVGVGAVAAVVIVILGVALAGFTLANAPLTMLGLVIAAEVGAKLGMAIIACFGTATHQGMGSALTDHADPRSVWLPILVAIPAGALTFPHMAAAVALGGAILGTVGVMWWAKTRLGGVSGDVFGAGNEIARVVGLHVGVIAWMHF